ncbi:MAG: hypothetical protein WC969_14955 [Elusimicrobiota bacterium]|jgi:hypothetical protein
MAVTTIWKFPVKIEDRFVVEMPRGAKVLSVAAQRGEPFMWAFVDPALPRARRVFRCAGTGHPVGGIAGSVFVGTFQLESLGLVFHLFDLNIEDAQP